MPGPAKKGLEVAPADGRVATSRFPLMKAANKGDALAALQSAALITAVFGAIAAIGLLRHAQQRPPPLIVFLFVIWVFAPFGLLGVANLLSKSWPLPVRKTLYVLTFVLAAVSLAIYVDDNFTHRTAHPAGVWVAVPAASVMLSAVVLAVAAWRSRRKPTL